MLRLVPPLTAIALCTATLASAQDAAVEISPGPAPVVVSPGDTTVIVEPTQGTTIENADALGAAAGAVPALGILVLVLTSGSSSVTASAASF